MFPELEIREGWVTVVCLLLMTLCVAWAIQAADWAEGLSILQFLVLGGGLTGIVLAKYAEQFELTNPGRPLYAIADLSELTLRAYVSGDQLPHVRLGQEVDVQIDADATSNQTLTGRITWIASEAEFTPKLIQTKEERVNLVYAIKVVVENSSGALKIGMPGEVWFHSATNEG